MSEDYSQNHVINFHGFKKKLKMAKSSANRQQTRFKLMINENRKPEPSIIDINRGEKNPNEIDLNEYTNGLDEKEGELKNEVSNDYGYTQSPNCLYRAKSAHTVSEKVANNLLIVEGVDEPKE